MKRGFTLVEVMMAAGLFLLIVAGTLSVYIMCMQTWHSTSLKMDTTHAVSLALSRMVYGLGTNSGLRSASFAEVNTNVLGAWNSSYSPWPQPPGASSHRVFTNFGSPTSWRITFSNEFDGLHYIDYNKRARNIVYWPVVTVNPYEPTRQLICDYVSATTASNTSDGIFISITVVKEDGRFVASNTVSTFVKIRNK